MLTSWDSFLAKHGIWLRPNHGDTGCQTHLLTPSPVEHTHRSHSHQIHCVDFFISLSGLGCMVTPFFFQKISVVSWHFVLILWGLPHLSFKYLNCSCFSPSFTDFGPYVEMYSSKPRVLALVQAQEQGIASPIRLQGSSKAPSFALRPLCTNLYSPLQFSGCSPGLWLCDPALAPVPSLHLSFD